MKTIAVLVVLILSFRVTCLAQITVLDDNKKDKVEQEILALVKKLPEVKSFFKHCPKEYKPAIDVAGTPDKSHNCYWFKIGISNFDMFRTTFDLIINPKTQELYYMDFMDVTGEHDLPLKTWRKWRNDPRFHQVHTFKHGKLMVVNASNL